MQCTSNGTCGWHGECDVALGRCVCAPHFVEDNVVARLQGCTVPEGFLLTWGSSMFVLEMCLGAFPFLVASVRCFKRGYIEDAWIQMGWCLLAASWGFVMLCIALQGGLYAPGWVALAISQIVGFPAAFKGFNNKYFAHHSKGFSSRFGWAMGIIGFVFGIVVAGFSQIPDRVDTYNALAVWFLILRQVFTMITSGSALYLTFQARKAIPRESPLGEGPPRERRLILIALGTTAGSVAFNAAFLVAPGLYLTYGLVPYFFVVLLVDAFTLLAIHVVLVPMLVHKEARSLACVNRLNKVLQHPSCAQVPLLKNLRRWNHGEANGDYHGPHQNARFRSVHNHHHSRPDEVASTLSLDVVQASLSRGLDQLQQQPRAPPSSSSSLSGGGMLPSSNATTNRSQGGAANESSFSGAT